MKVGILLKVADSVYLSVNNPKYIGLKADVATYDYIYDDVRNNEDIVRTVCHALGDQIGYYLSESRLKSSRLAYSPFDNVQLFVVELSEEEDQVIDNIADIMYSDYRTMPKTVPLITLEKVLISDLKAFLKKDISTIGERELQVRDPATLLVALS